MPTRHDRLPAACRRCRGRGMIDKRLGRLAGATARRPCPQCGGLRIRLE